MYLTFLWLNCVNVFTKFWPQSSFLSWRQKVNIKNVLQREPCLLQNKFFTVLLSFDKCVFEEMWHVTFLFYPFQKAAVIQNLKGENLIQNYLISVKSLWC